eukprot:scaffold31826_cov27-Tisochrysis_lutea.AAC.1
MGETVQQPADLQIVLPMKKLVLVLEGRFAAWFVTAPLITWTGIGPRVKMVRRDLPMVGVR